MESPVVMVVVVVMVLLLLLMLLLRMPRIARVGVRIVVSVAWSFSTE